MAPVGKRTAKPSDEQLDLATEWFVELDDCSRPTADVLRSKTSYPVTGRMRRNDIDYRPATLRYRHVPLETTSALHPIL